MYKKLIEELEPEDLPQALHLFQWICFAFTPLTLQELREATALDIHTSHASLEESRTFGQYAETDEEMERRVLSLSQGLAEVGTHDPRRIVQLVHQSVMDFLLQEGFRLFGELLPGDRLKGSVIARGHFWISRACIKYFSMEEVTSFRVIASGPHNPETIRSKELSLRFVLVLYAARYWMAHAQIVEQENVLQDDLLAQPNSSVLRALSEWGCGTNDVILNRVFLIRQGMTMLHIASSFGLSKLVSCILERDTRNTEIDERDYGGQTPLHCAAEAGHEAIVKQLLGNTAGYNAKNSLGQTPILYAAEGGHRGVVYLLLEAGAAVDPRDDVGWTPLSLAVERGHKDVVELLLELGAKSDPTDNATRTPLSSAVMSRRTDIVELLLKWTAKVDTVDPIGETPLSVAVMGGRKDMVELLLDGGAKIDHVDMHGQTPLFYAAYIGSQTLVKLLLEKGAQVNIMDKKGDTPLSLAAQEGDYYIVKLLLEKGAQVNIMDKKGDTLLSLAAQEGDYYIVKLLLEKGAQVNIMDKKGDTPLSLAVQEGNQSIVKLLLEHGANPDFISDKALSCVCSHRVLELLQCAEEGRPLPPVDLDSPYSSGLSSDGELSYGDCEEKGVVSECHAAPASPELQSQDEP